MQTAMWLQIVSVQVSKCRAGGEEGCAAVPISSNGNAEKKAVAVKKFSKFACVIQNQCVEKARGKYIYSDVETIPRQQTENWKLFPLKFYGRIWVGKVIKSNMKIDEILPIVYRH